MSLLSTFNVVVSIDAVCSQSLTNTIHKTQAAAERHNDMWCYACHSMEDGDICIDNITANYSTFMKKCKEEEFICMVKKFSYTTSTENVRCTQRWKSQFSNSFNFFFQLFLVNIQPENVVTRTEMFSSLWKWLYRDRRTDKIVCVHQLLSKIVL